MPHTYVYEESPQLVTRAIQDPLVRLLQSPENFQEQYMHLDSRLFKRKQFWMSLSDLLILTFILTHFMVKATKTKLYMKSPFFFNQVIKFTFQNN